MSTKKHKKHVVDSLAGEWNCVLKRNAKEWAFYDNADGAWVSGCAMVSGREIKDPCVKLFLKKIKEKRANQQPENLEKSDG